MDYWLIWRVILDWMFKLWQTYIHEHTKIIWKALSIRHVFESYVYILLFGTSCNKNISQSENSNLTFKAGGKLYWSMFVLQIDWQIFSNVNGFLFPLFYVKFQTKFSVLIGMDSLFVIHMPAHYTTNKSILSFGFCFQLCIIEYIIT